MQSSGRLFLCVCCRAQVVICSHCDRGQIYCAADCAQAARCHAVREAGRVLMASGHFCICVAHPMTDVGRIKEPSARGDLVISGSYFEHQRINETVTKDGLEMTFHGWTYTLEDYVRVLEDAGFLIERVREPVPSAEQATTRPSLKGWRRVPLFLFIRAIKRSR